MNNFEKIKAMDIEEMADFFTKYSKWLANNLLNDIGLINIPEIPMPKFTTKSIKRDIKKWLEAEREEVE